MREISSDLIPVLADRYAALAQAAVEAQAALGRGGDAELRCDWMAFAGAQKKVWELMMEIRAIQDRTADNA
jgi:hypothetical protein